MKSAFRNVPLRLADFQLLLMKAECPIDGRTYLFVDKCLPFGSSISCKIFQEFLCTVSHVITFRCDGKPNVNYLDDFLFIALFKAWCNNQVKCFLNFCQEIGFPVAMEKTLCAENIIVFLGLLIDLVEQVVCIPREKILKAQHLIDIVLNSKKNKATILQIQRLAGYLNFLCKMCRSRQNIYHEAVCSNLWIFETLPPC